MSDLGNLSQSIVYGDPGEVGLARRLRGRALAASMLLETGVVGCLLLWPLMKTAVLPVQYMPAPVPVFHRVPNPPLLERQAEHPASKQPSILRDPALHQPPRIPPHVVADTDQELPSPFDLPMRTGLDGLGPEFGGDGPQGANVARPEAKRSTVPIVVSAGVMAALVIHRVQPEYPPAARLIHLAGTVQLRAIIGTDGSVGNLEVVSGNPILAAAAVEAVRQWRYQPTRLNGKPVEVETVITVQFQMQ